MVHGKISHTQEGVRGPGAENSELATLLKKKQNVKKRRKKG